MVEIDCEETYPETLWKRLLCNTHWICQARAEGGYPELMWFCKQIYNFLPGGDHKPRLPVKCSKQSGLEV